MKIAIILFAIICMNSSCGINPKELTTIDNIILGQERDKTFEAINSNRYFSRENLLTKTYFEDIISVKENFVSWNITEMFDYGSYQNRSIKQNHIGIPHILWLEGTNNVIALNILLAHTCEVPFYNDIMVKSITNNERCVVQDVNESLLNEILRMYISKYGDPLHLTQEINHELFVINGRDIMQYDNVNNYDGKFEVYKWETDHLIITFFKGLWSRNYVFNSKTISYNEHMTFGDTNDKINIPEPKLYLGERRSWSYPFIQYRLKPETIEKLGLNKKDI